MGISLDGPKQFHDAHRKNASGEGSFERVIGTTKNLNLHEIKFGTICVVTDPNVLDYYPNFTIENNLSRLNLILI
ncbi:MAG: hypothetical protein Q8N88_06140, partial [Nanoarchaeota archaeon]|nr:hypothetical protein [Nanoarchaeota archaeon]